MKPSKLRSEIRKYMARNEKTATHVASETQQSLSSVQRFLSGETERPHELSVAAYLRLLADEQKPEGARA